MAKITNVLSLFDGLSCGQIALNEIGLVPSIYYASEIDKHAISQTQLNFPNTIQLGSVTEVNVADLEPIDLLIGGSPCQSFSFAGKRNGMTTSCNEEIYTLERYLELKEDGFQFEGESYLFWEYMRILTDIRKYNPDVMFLLENVEMGKKWERVLSEAIGIYGVHINSALVSAQNRKRIYWTNIKTKTVGMFGELYSDIPQPKDRGILLKDILEKEVAEKYYLSGKMLAWLDKHANKRGVEVKKLDGEQKAACLTATAQVKQNLSTDYVCVAMRGRGENNEQTLEPQTSGKTNSLTSVQKDNLVMQLNPSKESGGKQPYQQNRIYSVDGIMPAITAQLGGRNNILIPEATAKGYVEIEPGECFDAENINSKTRRGRKMDDKSNCLMAKETDFMQYTQTNRIRRLTPTECARLQNVPDWYKWECSDTQQYRMLGNGWSVEVIKHIFSFITL